MSISRSPLDLLLKSFLNSSEFNEQQERNWDALCRVVPGVTPKQCEARYQELLQQELSGSSDIGKLPSRGSGSGVSSGRGSKIENDASDVRLSRPSSAKSKGSYAGSKPYKDSSQFKLSDSSKLSGDQGPTMVIHVCDEAKNLKQDFHCPRDLLVREMKYFAEYLSIDAQRWEEVDISVHCDVQIFDWLMKYVKRGTKEVSDLPKLEPTNVISILISSDFLKMDTLVEGCIQFCHANMSAIVATPCNMNCINDKLVSRIADLFNHNEADEVKDRKDKFKSKLFMKKLEKLFSADTNNKCSPENASTLYRCKICKRLLTKNYENKVRCSQSRMTVDRTGNLIYSHSRDTSWDVNEYLIELKNELKTWRDVYWRLWGQINFLKCSRCDEYFPSVELSHCRYHIEQPTFDLSNAESSKSPNGAVGEYPCCGEKTLRFDPTQPNKGCRVRDHVVSLDKPNKDNSDSIPVENRVYDDLLAHKDAICIPLGKLEKSGNDDVNVFKNEEFVMGIRAAVLNVPTEVTSQEEASKAQAKSVPCLQPLTVERDIAFDEDIGFGESDDELGDEETGKVRKPRSTRKSRVTVDPQAILLGAPDFSTTKSRKWDTSRTLRWNQDAQREEDQRRMNEITTYLTNLRLNTGNDKTDRTKHREYAGGIFSKLEAQWKAASISSSKPPTNQPLRSKTRLSQLKI